MYENDLWPYVIVFNLKNTVWSGLQLTNFKTYVNIMVILYAGDAWFLRPMHSGSVPRMAAKKLLVFGSIPLVSIVVLACFK